MPEDTVMFEGISTPAPTLDSPFQSSDSDNPIEPIDPVTPTVVLRRSQRERHPPDYY